jgi:acyl carrier protein
MTKQDFLKELEDLLEVAPQSLTGSEALDDLENWNSMAIVGYIALADTNGVRLSARDVGKCTTVADLLQLAKVEG